MAKAQMQHHHQHHHQHQQQQQQQHPHQHQESGLHEEESFSRAPPAQDLSNSSGVPPKHDNSGDTNHVPAKRGGHIQAPKAKKTTFKPVTANFDIDIGSFKQPLLRRLAHYYLHMPLYMIKFPFAILLGLWSALFWRTPTTEDVVAYIEGTSIVTVLRRDWPADGPAPPPSADTTTDVQDRRSREEQRHYSIRVERCLLEHVSRETGGTVDEGVVTPIKSWSMNYTKSRGGGRDAKWENKIHAFVVNGKALSDPESQLSFLHLYWTTGAHTKCHVFANNLIERIASDDSLKTKLSESTWTTRWLHHGLLHGSLGPLTTLRTKGNKWMGLGTATKLVSVVAESRNMSPLGGANHGRAARWSELELPLADFMMGARRVLRKAMRDNGIPMDLQESMFLSGVMHAVDHVLTNRILWGIKFKIDYNGERETWGDNCESASWNFIWVAPTLLPFYNNKIRSCTKPFYRQLYRGLKKIDTLRVADEVTASIMY